MRQAGMLAAEAEFKAKARFGTRPAGKITMEGDGVGCGKNRVLCEATQVATEALSVKVNAIAEATVVNDEFYYTDTCIKDADWTSSKVITDEVNELASSAFVN